jgi:hypothetical protein
MTIAFRIQITPAPLIFSVRQNCAWLRVCVRVCVCVCMCEYD